MFGKKDKKIPKPEKETILFEEVDEYFDIDVTETDTEFLVGVKRKSGEDMLFHMGLCDFPEYIDWWYGIKVVTADDGSKRYALKKGTSPIPKPDPKVSDVDEIKIWIKLFICEHPYAFRIVHGRNAI